MQIESIDASDETAWAAWHATYLASDTHGRPHATPLMRNELRVAVLTPTSGQIHQAFAGIDGGDVVATGWLEITLKDNLDTAYVEVHVLPERRRQGFGTRMLRHLEQLATDAGRSIVLTEVNHPFETGPEGDGHPSVLFVRSRGYELALGNIRRERSLPVEPELLSRLKAEAAPFHADYGFRHFAGPCPDDILEQFGSLMGTMTVEAPMGELDLEEEVFDAARLREDEQLFERAARLKYTTVALDSHGEPVAFTELVVPREDPGKVYQWGTLVAPEHRGHRLGMAVKVRNLEYLQANESVIGTVSTCNAEVNAAMVAINETLGFVPVERLAEFQKRTLVRPGQT